MLLGPVWGPRVEVPLNRLSRLSDLSRLNGESEFRIVRQHCCCLLSFHTVSNGSKLSSARASVKASAYLAFLTKFQFLNAQGTTPIGSGPCRCCGAATRAAAMWRRREAARAIARASASFQSALFNTVLLGSVLSSLFECLALVASPRSLVARANSRIPKMAPRQGKGDSAPRRFNNTFRNFSYRGIVVGSESAGHVTVPPVPCTPHSPRT